MSKDFASSADLADKIDHLRCDRPRSLRLHGRGRSQLRRDRRRRWRDGRRCPGDAGDGRARSSSASRKVTDKPIKYVLLTHYHAVRVLGASAYARREILASDTTRD